MKKYLVSLFAGVAFFAAFVSIVNAASAQKVPVAEMTTTVTFQSGNYEFINAVSSADKILTEFSRRMGGDFTLMPVNMEQWKMMQAMGVKLVTMSENDVRLDWLDVKFGFAGPVLALYNGKPCFTLKDKSGFRNWTYDVDEVAAFTQTFWVAVDVRRTIDENPKKGI